MIFSLVLILQTSPYLYRFCSGYSTCKPLIVPIYVLTPPFSLKTRFNDLWTIKNLDLLPKDNRLSLTAMVNY
jgi:hypothetical protein